MQKRGEDRADMGASCSKVQTSKLSTKGQGREREERSYLELKSDQHS